MILAPSRASRPFAPHSGASGCRSPLHRRGAADKSGVASARIAGAYTCPAAVRPTEPRADTPISLINVRFFQGSCLQTRAEQAALLDL